MDKTTTAEQSKRDHNQNDPAGETVRAGDSSSAKTPRPPLPPGDDGGSSPQYSDDEFWSDFPDDPAARAWFESVFWPDVVHCPWCESCHVDALVPDARLPFRCRKCERDFSVISDTLMDGLKVPLLEWAQALFIFTGGPILCSHQELGRRIGWDEKTAREATYRLLQAMDEPIVPLREPAELDAAWLRYPPGHDGEVQVIALVGRRSKRVAGIKRIFSETKAEIEPFVNERLAPGMTLFTDSHLSVRDIRDVDQPKGSSVNHRAGEYTRGPGCINLDEGLWRRMKRLLQVEFDWFSDGHLHPWLAGIQWRENRLSLSHQERMVQLAQDLRSKRPRFTPDPLPEQPRLEPPSPPRCQSCQNSECRAERGETISKERQSRAPRPSEIRSTWNAA